MFGHKFPYTNFHEMNMDWLMEKIAWIEDKLSKTIDIPLASKVVYGRVKIGKNIKVYEGEISLDPATTQDLGLVKVGSGLQVAADGTLSAITPESGDSVEVLPLFNEGTPIANVKVNNVNNIIYTPPVKASAPMHGVTFSDFTTYVSDPDYGNFSVWVDFQTGNDTYPGTYDAPVATISHAYEVAKALNDNKKISDKVYYSICVKFNAANETHTIEDFVVPEDEAVVINGGKSNFSSSTTHTLKFNNLVVHGILALGKDLYDVYGTTVVVSGGTWVFDINGLLVTENGTLMLDLNTFDGSNYIRGTNYRVQPNIYSQIYGTLIVGKTGVIGTLNTDNSGIDTSANTKVSIYNTRLYNTYGASSNVFIGSEGSAPVYKLMKVQSSANTLIYGNAIVFKHNCGAGVEASSPLTL